MATNTLTAASYGITVPEFIGTWYVIGVDSRDGEPVFLLEHEEYGDETAHIIVDEHANLIYDDIWNGFDDMYERDEIIRQILENDRLLKEREFTANRERLSNEIEAVLNNELDIWESVMISPHTPAILQEIGLTDYPILMSQRHVRNCLHEKGKSSRWHGLSKEYLSNIAEYLSNPAIIYDSLTGDESVVVVTDQVDSDKLPIIVSIKTNGSGQYEFNVISTNYLTSTYGHEHLENIIDRAIQGDDVLYVNKEKTQALEAFSSLQLLGRFSNSIEFNQIIHKSNNIVNETEELVLTDKVEENTFYYSASENSLDISVKEWYLTTFPDDDLGYELKDGFSFKDVEDVLNQMSPQANALYNLMGVRDSTIRERVFQNLADLTNVDYDDVYNKWLIHERKINTSQRSRMAQQQEQEAFEHILLNNFFGIAQEPSQKYSTTEKESFRDKVAKEFVKSLQEEPRDWVKAWASNDTGKPFNMASGRVYNGVNAFWLKFIERAKGWQDPRWLTFNQVRKLNEKRLPEDQIKILKGTKMTPVEYFYMFDRLTKKTIPWEKYNALSPEEKGERIDISTGQTVTDNGLFGSSIRERYILQEKDHYVFNASQLTNIPEYKFDKVENDISPSEVVERVSDGMGVKIEEKEQDKAAYSPSRDVIILPLRSQFYTDYDYQSTALHELGHATGHESRLNRDIHNSFGTPEYAYEELIAELTSCFMGEWVEAPMSDADLGNHIGYVQGWIEKINNDKNYLFRAIKEAEKASDFMVEKGKLLELKEEKAKEKPSSKEEGKVKMDAVKSIAEEQTPYRGKR